MRTGPVREGEGTVENRRDGIVHVEAQRAGVRAAAEVELAFAEIDRRGPRRAGEDERAGADLQRRVGGKTAGEFKRPPFRHVERGSGGGERDGRGDGLRRRREVGYALRERKPRAADRVGSCGGAERQARSACRFRERRAAACRVGIDERVRIVLEREIDGRSVDDDLARAAARDRDLPGRAGGRVVARDERVAPRRRFGKRDVERDGADDLKSGRGERGRGGVERAEIDRHVSEVEVVRERGILERDRSSALDPEASAGPGGERGNRLVETRRVEHRRFASDLHRARLGVGVCIDPEDVRACRDYLAEVPREHLSVVGAEIDFLDRQPPSIEDNRGSAAVRLLLLCANDKLLDDRLAAVDGDRAGTRRASGVIIHHGTAQLRIDPQKTSIERKRGRLGFVIVAHAEITRTVRCCKPERSAVDVHGSGATLVNADEVAAAGGVAARLYARALVDVDRPLPYNKALS